MMKSEVLYIIIPAYNESENIEEVVREWHEVVAKTNKTSRLVIIDDGSKDDTYEKLKRLNKKYKQLTPVTKKNSGHGGTVLYGYHYAIKNRADYVFQTDSDGQTRPDEFWQMWNERENYNFQCGHRLGRQDGFSRKFVTRVLKLVVLLKFRCWAKDANTPFRLMDIASLKGRVEKIPKDYNLSNVMLTVLYLKDKSMKNRFIHITFRPRQGGVNSINMKRIIGIGKKAMSDFGRLRNVVDDD